MKHAKHTMSGMPIHAKGGGKKGHARKARPVKKPKYGKE